MEGSIRVHIRLFAYETSTYTIAKAVIIEQSINFQWVMSIQWAGI